MIFVPNDQHHPSVNLALETYLLKEKKLDEPLLLFYINEPSIIIGRNQNTIEEINQEYVAEKGIHVVRRLSGGGAVYHDFGNLNFSFILPDDGTSFRDFKKLTQPIIEALHRLGVTDAQLKGRNDLVIQEMKFSGNAMYATEGRMFAHGTLLFDSDLDEVTKALNVRQDKIASKGIKSIRSRVTNIKPFLPPEKQEMTTKAFQTQLLLNIFAVDTVAKIPTYVLTQEDWEKVEAIADTYYRNWDWNYGQSPAFNLKRTQRFPIGSIDVHLDVAQGKIQQAKIYGDFFGLGEIKEVEDALLDVAYEKTALAQVVQTLDLNQYFGAITPEEFLALLY